MQALERGSGELYLNAPAFDCFNPSLYSLKGRPILVVYGGTTDVARLLLSSGGRTPGMENRSIYLVFESL